MYMPAPAWARLYPCLYEWKYDFALNSFTGCYGMLLSVNYHSIPSSFDYNDDFDVIALRGICFLNIRLITNN